ncbi:hypothetical protein M885DRAFT_621548 [Pelagophyceae sp. CCMP2097]|nr:hypothetical protein M885DRAFT_621548 [Pelagophyceae sp. CCMP2097]
MAFAPGPDMATPRSGCAAVALDEYRTMVTGGESDSGRLNTTEIFDIRTMAFVPGGCGSPSTILATSELLDVATMEFEPGPAMLTARCGGAAVCLGAVEVEPRILVLGGRLSTTEVLAVDALRGAHE